MLHHVEPYPVCEDLVLAVLAKLPSRELVQARNVSRGFQVLADEVLRKRFLDIAESRSNQLVLESCAPYEQRAQHRQPLSFSHFAPATDVFSGNVALFAVDAAAGEPDPLQLALEDGDVFQQSILSVHLRAASPTQAARAPAPAVSISATHDVAVDMDTSTDDDDLAQPVAAPRFIDYAWTLDVATSLDRFFRSWFLESASEASSASSSPSSSRESSPQPPSPSRDTRRRQLGSPAYNARGRSALLSASISCVQVPLDAISPEGDEADVLWTLASRNGASSSTLSPSSSSSPGTRFGSPMSSSSASSSRTYEYFFDEVALDVGKVVVLAEEGLPGFARETSASELGTRAGARVLSL
ncbi:hypothetical protein JCM9279_001148 [Rhodotorula babjevae]